jgi:hypothetical protein
MGCRAAEILAEEIWQIPRLIHEKKSILVNLLTTRAPADDVSTFQFNCGSDS